MGFQKRLTQDTETLSGRVLKGLPKRFRDSISPREKAIDHLSAALALWIGLNPEIKALLMNILEKDPEAPLAEKVASFFEKPRMLAAESRPSYNAKKLHTVRSPSETG